MNGGCLPVVMNLYILIIVSLPEAFFNLIIFLLIAGAKDKLKINKPNVIRFAASLVTMLAASSIIRPVAPNVVVNVVSHCLVYIVIIMLIYRLKLRYASLSVVFTMLMFSSIENLYYPFIIAYISKGTENYMKHYQWIALYAIPSRVMQVGIILFLWKYEILLVTKISKKFHKAFIISTFAMIIVEYFFAYTFANYFSTYSLSYQVVFAAILFLMTIVFCFIIFQTVYVAIGDVITKGFTKYSELEENAKLAFDVINDLIKDNKTVEAMNLINELKGNAK